MPRAPWLSLVSFSVIDHVPVHLLCVHGAPSGSLALCWVLGSRGEQGEHCPVLQGVDTLLPHPVMSGSLEL